MIDEKTEFCQPCTEAPMTKKEIKAKRKAERKEQKRLKKERKLREKDKLHRVRGIVPFTRLVPYIMETRNTSQNFIFDKIGMEKIDKYIKRKQEEGLAGLTLMHVIIGAYCRAVCRPHVGALAVFRFDAVINNMVEDLGAHLPHQIILCFKMGIKGCAPDIGSVDDILHRYIIIILFG
mgnify:CR=1 FL=1